MAVATFTFTSNPGYTPVVTLYRADTLAQLGVPTPATARIAGTAHYTVSIDIGAYVGPLLAKTETPKGGYHGHTLFAALRDEPYDPTTGNGTAPLAVTCRRADNVVVAGAVCALRSGGAIVAWGTTNGAGLVTFYLMPGTYMLEIQTMPGYTSPAPQAVTVPATAAVTVTVQPQTPAPPAAAGTVVGTWVTYNEQGVAVDGMAVVVQLVQAPPNTTGKAYDTLPRTLTSAGGGLVQVPGMHPGATYHVKRGTGPTQRCTVPPTAVGIVELADIIGAE